MEIYCSAVLFPQLFELSVFDRFKFWEDKVGRYVLQKLGQGWKTIAEYDFPITSAELEDVPIEE